MNAVVKSFMHGFVFLLAMTPAALLVSCNSTAVSENRSDATESGSPWEGYEKAFWFDIHDSTCVSTVEEAFAANNIDWKSEGSVVYVAYIEKARLSEALSIMAMQKNLYMYGSDILLVSSRSDLDLPRWDSSNTPSAKSPAK